MLNTVDLQSARTGATRRAHHTNEYESDALIVRRGQPFTLRLGFRQPYDPEEHRVCLEFLLGECPPLPVQGPNSPHTALGTTCFPLCTPCTAPDTAQPPSVQHLAPPGCPLHPMYSTWHPLVGQKQLPPPPPPALGSVPLPSMWGGGRTGAWPIPWLQAHPLITAPKQFHGHPVISACILPPPQPRGTDRESLQPLPPPSH